MRYKVTMIEAYDFEVEADSAEDARKFMIANCSSNVRQVSKHRSGRVRQVYGGYRRTAHANVPQPDKPSDDEGYMKVLAEMGKYDEINMGDAPNLLKDWYGISKLEAVRLFNQWATSLSEEEQLNLF